MAQLVNTGTIIPLCQAAPYRGCIIMIKSGTIYTGLICASGTVSGWRWG